MTQSSIATAADYADAMLTARRAKNWLFLLLLLMLLGQLAIFFAMRYVPPLTEATQKGSFFRPLLALEYLVSVIDFLGVALSMVLIMVLGLIVGIMLVGRLIGVSRVMSAFIWSLILVALLFPWQSLLGNAALYPAPRVGQGVNVAVPANLSPEQDFRIPGVLYTWGELTHPTVGANFATNDLSHSILHWSRYLVFPLLALIMLLYIQVCSSRGLRMALGEAEAAGDSQAPPSP